jgi:hypothetical protein
MKSGHTHARPKRHAHRTIKLVLRCRRYKRVRDIGSRPVISRLYDIGRVEWNDTQSEICLPWRSTDHIGGQGLTRARMRHSSLSERASGLMRPVRSSSARPCWALHTNSVAATILNVAAMASRSGSIVSSYRTGWLYSILFARRRIIADGPPIAAAIVVDRPGHGRSPLHTDIAGPTGPPFSYAGGQASGSMIVGCGQSHAERRTRFVVFDPKPPIQLTVLYRNEADFR